jgi:hypothetical protein
MQLNRSDISDLLTLKKILLPAYEYLTCIVSVASTLHEREININSKKKPVTIDLLSYPRNCLHVDV